MNLVGMDMIEARKMMQVTLLQRVGCWYPVEIDRLMIGLQTIVSHHPKHPECVMLFGHYTKPQILATMQGGATFTAKQITGVYQNPELKELLVPFV